MKWAQLMVVKCKTISFCWNFPAAGEGVMNGGMCVNGVGCLIKEGKCSW